VVVVTSSVRRGAGLLLGFVFAMLPAVLVLAVFDLKVSSISIPWWANALALLLTVVTVWLSLVYLPRGRPF